MIQRRKTGGSDNHGGDSSVHINRADIIMPAQTQLFYFTENQDFIQFKY